MRKQMSHPARAASITVFLTTILVVTLAAPSTAAATTRVRSGTAVSADRSNLAAEQAALYPLERIVKIHVTADCPPVKRALPERGSAGTNSVGCTGPGGTVTAADARALPAATSLCKLNAVTHNRHASCGVATLLYSVVQVPSGKVLGTGTFLVAYSEALNPASRSWSLPVSIEMTAATGVVSTGTEPTIGIDCKGGCTPSPAWSGPSMTVLQVYSHTFHPSSPGTATNTTHQVPIVALVNPAGTTQSPPFILEELGPARCDTGVAFKGTKGCVFDDAAGLYTIHLHGSAGAVAAHVQVAQRTKPRHFGWLGHGTALTRATPGSVAARNRRVACPRRKYPNPDTCDEYPFAATYQGAAFFPASNSTAPVSASENSAEGAFRVAMYRTERLFDHDRYWVLVVP
jgi:hypothetical protein